MVKLYDSKRQYPKHGTSHLQSSQERHITYQVQEWSSNHPKLSINTMKALTINVLNQ
jgi:hypothetical protein